MWDIKLVLAVLLCCNDLGSPRKMDYYAPRRWDDPDSDSDSNEDEKTESAEDIEAYYSAQCELKHLPFQVFFCCVEWYNEYTISE